VLFYRVGGVLLRSELAFASLLPAAFAEGPQGSSAPLPADSIALLAAEGPFGEPERWLYNERFEDTADPWRAVGVLGGRYLVRLFDLADFLLDRGERTARVFLAPGAPVDVVEPLFLEQALPLFLSLVGRPCLHAGAVAWGEGEGARAIAFAGRSGSGKSTLASSLAAPQGDASGPAAALLADDCLAIELAADRVLAHPGHRSVRLLADSAAALFASASAGEASIDGGKRRLDLRGGTRVLPLARIYLLEIGAAPRVTVLRPRDAVAQLAACLFRIDPEDRSRFAEELALLDRIAARTVVARLAVPRRFEALAGVRAALAADLEHDTA
jgi:hypothetical protein